MAGYRVMLDSRGVNFNLGTKKKPSDLFPAWDQKSRDQAQTISLTWTRSGEVHWKLMTASRSPISR
jgi:hypothetical protein